MVHTDFIPFFTKVDLHGYVKVREQQRIATEALNTVTVASPPKKRARQRETGPSRSPSPVAPVAREEVAQTTRAAKAIASGTSKTQASPGHGMSRYSGSVVWDSAPTSTARDDGVLAQSQEEEEEQEDIVLTPEEQDYHPDEYWSRPPYDEELFYESEPSEEEIYSDWEADSIAEESQHKRSRHDEGQSRPRHQQQASQSPPREQPRATHSSPHRRTVYCLEDIQELPMYPPASQLVGNNASKGLELLENSTEEVLELEKAISILSTRKKDIRTHMEDLRRHLTKLEQGIPPSLPGGMPRAFSIPRAGPSSSSFSTPRAGHSSSSPRGDENVLRSKKFREPRKKRLWSDEESAALKEAFRRYGHSAREIKAAIGKHGQILQHWDAGSIRSRIRVMTRKKEL